jgi:hypothetical protein
VKQVGPRIESLGYGHAIVKMKVCQLRNSFHDSSGMFGTHESPGLAVNYMMRYGTSPS